MTSITVDLPDDLAARVKQQAEAQGAQVSEVVLATVREQFASDATAAVLQERINRMDAGAGVDAREAVRSIARKRGLTVPS